MNRTRTALYIEQTGAPPKGDDVHECHADDCDAWRYSVLALEYHYLREHTSLRGGLE